MIPVERWAALRYAVPPSERVLRAWCRDGDIPGAERVGRRWMVPQDAVRRQRASLVQRLMAVA